MKQKPSASFVNVFTNCLTPTDGASAGDLVADARWHGERGKYSDERKKTEGGNGAEGQERG